MTRAEFTRKWLGNQSKGYNSYHRDEMFEDLDSVIENSVKNCNLHIVKNWRFFDEPVNNRIIGFAVGLIIGVLLYACF